MTSLTGRVLYPGDPGWDFARHGFCSRFDYDAHIPRAVVFCQDQQDVVNAVRWARAEGVPLRVRSGRHNYEGTSSLVKDGLVIDISEMEFVRVNSRAQTVRVGAGIDMLELTEQLWDSGVTVPLATGPSVGLAGLVLGGGFGVTTRKLGLTSDNLESIELVLADGSCVTASATSHPDLFWACQGGGGSFGIATAFTFRVHRVGLVAVFNLTYPWEAFQSVVDAWQHWGPAVDDGISSLLSIRADRTIALLGQYTASPEELGKMRDLLQPMLTVAPLVSASMNLLPHVIAARMFFGVDPVNPSWAVRQHGDKQIYKASSAFAFAPLPAEALARMEQSMNSVPPLSAPPSQPSMIQLLAGGGMPGRIPVDQTAIYFREAKFILQYDAFWTAPQDGEGAMRWMREFRDGLAPWTRGAYVNYVDAGLTNWGDDYFGPHLARLSQVKRTYDPDNVFAFPQSIPPA